MDEAHTKKVSDFIPSNTTVPVVDPESVRDVYRRVPMCLRWLSLMYLSLLLIGSLMLCDPEAD